MNDKIENKKHLLAEPAKYDVVYKASANFFEVYINEEIGSPNEYTKLISFLRGLKPIDEVRFYINSPGGRLDAGMQLLNAIADCEGYVSMVIDGNAYSMASFLVFSGNEIIVNENAMLMIHNYSAGHIGKGGELLNSAEAYNKMMKRLMHTYFSDFLSEQEIVDVLNGKDMYMDAAEINERLKKRRDHDEEEKIAIAVASASSPKSKKKVTKKRQPRNGTSKKVCTKSNTSI